MSRNANSESRHHDSRQCLVGWRHSDGFSWQYYALQRISVFILGCCISSGNVLKCTDNNHPFAFSVGPMMIRQEEGRNQNEWRTNGSTGDNAPSKLEMSSTEEYVQEGTTSRYLNN